MLSGLYSPKLFYLDQGYFLMFSCAVYTCCKSNDKRKFDSNVKAELLLVQKYKLDVITVLSVYLYFTSLSVITKSKKNV